VVIRRNGADCSDAYQPGSGSADITWLGGRNERRGRPDLVSSAQATSAICSLSSLLSPTTRYEHGPQNQSAHTLRDRLRTSLNALADLGMVEHSLIDRILDRATTYGDLATAVAPYSAVLESIVEDVGEKSVCYRDSEPGSRNLRGNRYQAGAGRCHPAGLSECR
jgi:hypothetical protein